MTVQFAKENSTESMNKIYRVVRMTDKLKGLFIRQMRTTKIPRPTRRKQSFPKRPTGRIAAELSKMMDSIILARSFWRMEEESGATLHSSANPLTRKAVTEGASCASWWRCSTPFCTVCYILYWHDKGCQDQGLHCSHTILREPKLYKSNKTELYCTETRWRPNQSIWL